MQDSMIYLHAVRLSPSTDYYNSSTILVRLSAVLSSSLQQNLNVSSVSILTSLAVPMLNGTGEEDDRI